MLLINTQTNIIPPQFRSPPSPPMSKSSSDICLWLNELSIGHDNSSSNQADTGGESGQRNSNFSQLIMMVAPETHVFFFSLLWTLKERGMVLHWHWEDGILRMLADTELILSRTSIPDGFANSWLLRLIEAAHCHDYFPYHQAEDSATDFSFLGDDMQQSMLQSA